MVLMLLHMKAGHMSTVTLGKSVLRKQHWAGKSKNHENYVSIFCD